jgi:hypothetical protein
MRFHWGVGIAVLYSVFALATLAMVFYSTTQREDLVSADYYDKEMKYEEHIRTVNRTQKLLSGVTWEVKNNVVAIRFPQLMDKKCTGVIRFYRPSDGSKDFNVAIAPSAEGLQIVSLEAQEQGMWRIKIEWKMDTDAYFNEGILFVKAKP